MLVMRIAINGSASVLEGRVGPVFDSVGSARDDGFRSFWLAQTTAVDALTAFAASAEHGLADGMEFGTAVVPTFVQHPLALAAKAWTAQDACRTRGGSVVLGVGLSHEPTVRDRLEMEWAKPVRHMHEYLEILTALFEDRRVDFSGEIWSAHAEMGLDVDPPALMIAAMGPQMLGLAGRMTDGTILWMVGPKTIGDHIVPTIGKAAADSGRPAPRIVASLPVCVTGNPDPVRDFAGAVFADYGDLPSYRAMLDREGADGPADVCIIGDEEHVSGVLDELENAGTTDFAAVEFPTNDEERAATRALLKERREAAG